MSTNPREYQREYMRRQRAIVKAQEQRRCQSCLGVIEPGTDLMTCAKCRARGLRKRLRYDENGLCQRCGHPKPDRRYCQCATCNEEHRDWKRHRALVRE